MTWYFLAFKKYGTFRGRASRREFWLFALFNLIAANIIGLVAGLVAGRVGHPEVVYAAIALFYLATLVPYLAVTVRRLHDTGRSAWWLLIVLLPVLGAIALVVFLALKGEKNVNRYGVDPLVTDNVAPVDHCPKCGEPCTPDENFCGACATPLPHPPARTASKNRRMVVAALVVFVAAGAGVLIVVLQHSRNQKQTSGLPPLGPIVQVPPAVLFRGTASANNGTGTPSQVDIAAAERDFARHPDDPKILNDLGCLLEASGATTRGHALLSQAHTLSPNDSDIGYNYARSLFQQGKVDEAGQEADRLIAQNSDSAEARLLKAGVAVQKRDYATAQDQIDNVLKNDRQLLSQGANRPGKVTQILKAIQMTALVIQGVIDLSKGRTQQGLSSFQAALKLGDNSAALYNTGVAYQQLGQPAQAVPYYQRAIEAQPTLAEAHNNLGGLMLAQNDVPGAQKELQMASTLKPELQPAIQAAFEAATKADSKTAGAIQLEEFRRYIQNVIARFSGKKSMSLQAAVKSGAVEATGQLTANTLRVQLKKTAQAGSGVLELSVQPGSILTSGSDQFSDLVVTKVIGRETVGQRYIPGPISLSDSEPVIYALDGYLAALKPPPQNVALSVARPEPDLLLACVASQTRLPTGSTAVQLAIWMETAGLSATQWQQARPLLRVSDADWSGAESLVTECKTHAR